MEEHDEHIRHESRYQRQLDRIEDKLDAILRGERFIIQGEGILMQDQGALDAAIQSLSDHVAAVKTAVDSIVAKLAEAQIPVDLSAEVAALNDLGTGTQNIVDEVNNAVNPPVATEPPPVEVPPVDTTGNGGDFPPAEPVV